MHRGVPVRLGCHAKCGSLGFRCAFVARWGFRGTENSLNSPVRDFEKTRTEFQEILAKPIRELGLRVDGSPLERFVKQLYRELENKKE